VPSDLLRALVRAASIRSVSLALLGAILGGVSPVAVFKRIGPACVKWLGSVFAELACAGVGESLSGFAGRILVQDSTVISLPASCRKKYRGAANQRGSQPQARLQCVIDLVGNVVVWARYDDFRRNDQRSATADLFSFARPGDLLLRDRGYFTGLAIAKALSIGVDLITRLRFGTRLCVMHGMGLFRPFDLKEHLREGRSIDRLVYVGEQMLPMRLVALPLNEEHAAQRRRKARQDRDKRLHHSSAYYRQLGWAIFLTTVPRTQLSARQIGTLYRLRWRIEIVFKAAKSHVWAQHLPVRASVHLVEALLWARLLALFLQLRHLNDYDEHRRGVSLLRHATLFAVIVAQLLPLPKLSREATLRFITQPRRKRPGFHACFDRLFPSYSKLVPHL
jgi:hypothetical protein